MFTLLLKHELRDILLGPRFIAVFAICGILLLVSTVVGVSEFHRGVERHDEQMRANQEEVQAADNWFGVAAKAIRPSDPMSVFVSGVSFDLSEVATIGSFGAGTPSQSVYSSDTLFAFFRFLDFSFVFQTVVSLLAILFTYDRISGERASGTLRIVMSNAIPRVKLIAAKLAGAWIGLTVPLLLVVGLCVLLALFLGLPIDSSTAIRLSGFAVTSIIFLSCFLAVGLLVSAMTRDPSTSFLILLVLWAGFALVLPRVGTEVAGQIERPMTLAELEAEQLRFIHARMFADRARYGELTKEWQRETAGMSKEEMDQYAERKRVEMDENIRAIHRESSEAIGEHRDRLIEVRRVGVRNREQLALALSRLSPVGPYRIASMRLAGTGLEAKDKFEDEVREYGRVFQRFASDNQRISFAGDEPVDLDFSQMPRFEPSSLRPGEAIVSVMFDVGLLVLYTVLALAGTFVAFLRYDVR